MLGIDERAVRNRETAPARLRADRIAVGVIFSGLSVLVEDAGGRRL